MKIQPRKPSRQGRTVIGLDLSLTETGIAYNLDFTGILTPKGINGAKRLVSIREGVLSACKGADLVSMEGYAYGAKNQREALGELGGVVKVALYEAGIPYMTVPPTVIKKVATGKGTAPKEAVLVAAVKRLNYGGANHNESDASWARQIGLLKLGISEVELPKASIEAAEKFFEKAEVE